MNKHKINIESNNNNLYWYIVSVLFEHFCALKVSWIKELEELNIKGQRIFNSKLYETHKLSDQEILEKMRFLTKKLCNEKWIDYSDFMSKSVWRIRLFFNEFNKLVVDAVSRNNWWIISWDLLKWIKEWNISKVAKIAWDTMTKVKQIQEAKQFFEDWQKSLKDKRETDRQFLQQNFTPRKENKSKIEALDYTMASMWDEVVILKFVLWLLDEWVKLNQPSDLERFYWHESWLEKTPEVMQQIFNAYLNEKRYVENTWIDPEIKLVLIDIAHNAVKEKRYFTNNVNKTDYINNRFKIEFLWSDKWTPTCNNNYLQIFNMFLNRYSNQ